VAVIKYAGKHLGIGLRELAEVFKFGKTQVGQILKNKESLLSMYESNSSGSRIHTGLSCPSELAEVNKALYECI